MGAVILLGNSHTYEHKPFIRCAWFKFCRRDGSFILYSYIQAIVQSYNVRVQRTRKEKYFFFVLGANSSIYSTFSPRFFKSLALPATTLYSTSLTLHWPTIRSMHVYVSFRRKLLLHPSSTFTGLALPTTRVKDCDEVQWYVFAHMFQQSQNTVLKAVFWATGAKLKKHNPYRKPFHFWVIDSENSVARHWIH